MARGCLDCERAYGPRAECRCTDPETACVDCERANGPGATCTCVMDQVANELLEHDVDARVEYPGAIHMDCDAGLFVAGTANGPWGVDFYAPEHAQTMAVSAGSFETTVPGDCEEADVIARALLAGIAQFEVARRAAGRAS